MCLNRQKDKKRGGGRQGMVGGVEQGALYNDRVFTWWLIVLHGPDCGLKRHALVFAEWCTVLPQCQDVMLGCLKCSLVPLSHTPVLLLYAVSVSSNHWQKQGWLTHLHFLPLYKNKARIWVLPYCVGDVVCSQQILPNKDSCTSWKKRIETGEIHL